MAQVKVWWIFRNQSLYKLLLFAIVGFTVASVAYIQRHHYYVPHLIRLTGLHNSTNALTGEYPYDKFRVIFAKYPWKFTKRDSKRSNVNAMRFDDRDTGMVVNELLQSGFISKWKNDSKLESPFSLDFVPSWQKFDYLEKDIHICLTAGTYRAAAELRVLLQSILLHALRLNTHLHIIASNRSELIISRLMERMNANLSVSYEIKVVQRDFLKEQIISAGIHVTKNTDLYRLSKAFLFRTWENVEKCIYVDINSVFGTDPAFLWAEFKRFSNETLIMMRLDERDFARSSTGVMLLHLQRMRELNFDRLYHMVVKQSPYCRAASDFHGNLLYDCDMEEREIYHSLFISSGRKHFLQIPTSWNLKICRKYNEFNFSSHLNFKDGLFFGIAHFGCDFEDPPSFTGYLTHPDSNEHLQSYIRELMVIPVDIITSRNNKTAIRVHETKILWPSHLDVIFRLLDQLGRTSI